MVRLGARYSNVGLAVCFGPGDLGPCSGTSSLERDWYGGVTDQKGSSCDGHVKPPCGSRMWSQALSRGRGTLPYASQHPGGGCTYGELLESYSPGRGDEKRLSRHCRLCVAVSNFIFGRGEVASLLTDVRPSLEGRRCCTGTAPPWPQPGKGAGLHRHYHHRRVAKTSHASLDRLRALSCEAAHARAVARARACLSLLPRTSPHISTPPAPCCAPPATAIHRSPRRAACISPPPNASSPIALPKPKPRPKPKQSLSVHT
jgi:hypothetical protein